MKKYLTYFILFLSVFSCKSSVSENMTGPSGSNVTAEYYFIDGDTGNDRFPGTLKKPLKTLQEVNKRLLKKVKSVYFAGGQTFAGTLKLNGSSGNDTTQIVISSIGDGRAIINGGDSGAIKIEKCRNILIKNLNVKGSGRKEGNTANGISISFSGKGVIQHIESSGFQKSGVYLYNCTDMQVKNIFASENGFCGINIMGSDKIFSKNIIIMDCRADNNPGDPANLTNHSGNGILVGVSDSVLIDHCTATNNGWDMPRKGNGPVGIWAWQSDNVTIQYCISYRNKTSPGAADGGGFDLDGGVTNSVIQYCLSYENFGAGYGLFQYSGASDWQNNIVRYCISINDGHTTKGAGSFFIWNGTEFSNQLSKCFIYNNLVYNDSGPVVSYEKSSAHTGFVFSNNIFLGSGEMINGKPKGSTFLGNVYWNAKGKIKFAGYNSLTEWAKASGQEMLKGNLAGMQIDPELNGPFVTNVTNPYELNTMVNFMLKPDSPQKNRGIDISSLLKIEGIKVDFYKNPVPSGNGTEAGIHEIN